MVSHITLAGAWRNLKDRGTCLEAAASYPKKGENKNLGRSFEDRRRICRLLIFSLSWLTAAMCPH